MNTFLLLALVTATTIFQASSTSLRGSTTSTSATIDEEQQHEHHRTVIHNVTCRLFLKSIELDVTEGKRSHEEWVCELLEEKSAKFGGFQYIVMDFDIDTIVGDNAAIVSGESALTISEAVVDTEEYSMHISSDALLELQSSSANMRRKLVPKDHHHSENSLILDTLVIRVIDSKGVAPEASLTQLEEGIFDRTKNGGDDNEYLQSQYELCTDRYEVRDRIPFSGVTDTNKLVSQGVVDVSVDFDMETATGDRQNGIQQAAFEAANLQLGDLNSNKYNNVVFCMPLGTGNWISYSFLDSKFSFYNNEWCSTIPASQVQCLD